MALKYDLCAELRRIETMLVMESIPIDDDLRTSINRWARDRRYRMKKAGREAVKRGRVRDKLRLEVSA